MHVQRSTGPASATPAIDTAGFSPEAIMATLRMRLDDLDSQIGRINQSINDKTRRARSINEQLGELDSIRQHVGSDGAIDLSDLTAAERDLLREHGVELPAEADVQRAADLQLIAAMAGDPTDAAVARFEERFGDRSVSEAARSVGLGGAAEVDDVLTSLGHVPVTESTLERVEQGLNRSLGQLNADNETTILQLQQIVSQRSQEVSLATQAMRAHSDSARNVIQNIG
jgi:prefoldin subunit 5